MVIWGKCDNIVASMPGLSMSMKPGHIQVNADSQYCTAHSEKTDGLRAI